MTDNLDRRDAELSAFIDGILTGKIVSGSTERLLAELVVGWRARAKESAPAADAGIVARLREALAEEVAYADRLAAELARRPHALNCAHRVHLQRCDCFVGREDAEHAARRGGAR